MSQIPQYNLLVTTGNDIPGCRINHVLGVVRGITVRSMTLGQGFSRIFQLSTYIGGRQSGYTPMCEQARRDAYDEMILHARQLGANAVIAMRYDATEIGPGMTEVLAYGTAVVVEQVHQ
ncbi:YbjQ family protein [Candidatus Sumerlaeota bacterium]|nr:YbjQ family protein [Candidatus Sumerlaeota bacterium]